MKPKVRWQLLLAFVPFLLMCNVVLFTPAAPGQTLHALLVIMDDDPTIGTTVVIDQIRVENLLIQIQRKRVCSVKKRVLLSSNGAATADNMRKWIKDVRPGRDDVVFVYFSGHGAMLDNLETFIALQGSSFLRSDLVEDIGRARDCRLKILITDSCSSAINAPADDAFLNPSLETALKNLFLQHEGFLHLAASTEGEYAFGDSGRGGWFTNSLVTTILERHDPNNDGFVSWKEIFQESNKRTRKLFTDAEPHFSEELKAKIRRRGITSQTPKYYSLPTPTSGSVRDNLIRSPRGD